MVTSIRKKSTAKKSITPNFKKIRVHGHGSNSRDAAAAPVAAADEASLESPPGGSTPPLFKASPVAIRTGRPESSRLRAKKYEIEKRNRNKIKGEK